MILMSPLGFKEGYAVIGLVFLVIFVLLIVILIIKGYGGE